MAIMMKVVAYIHTPSSVQLELNRCANTQFKKDNRYITLAQ